MTEYRPRLSYPEYKNYLTYQNKAQESRILVVADLHHPFVKQHYLEFCVDVKERYNCNKVMFVGDIFDNHFSSFHETDPDGFGGEEEFLKGRADLRLWYEVFPEADVCLGNHDLIPDRKRFAAGLSKHWMRPIHEALHVPRWNFKPYFVYDGVKYLHGVGKKARNRAKSDLCSIVQGHYHSEGYVDYFCGDTYKIFAMQLGAGIDRKSYAMAYAKDMPKFHVNCGVVIGGKQAILEYMEL